MAGIMGGRVGRRGLARRLQRALLAAAWGALLSGCQVTGGPEAQPGPGQVAAPSAEQPVPALPDTAPTEVRDDYDQILRQAQAALENGDHQTAMRYYERVLGRAEAPRDQVRALICMAMLRMMPSSGLADPQAAAIVMKELEQRVRDSGLEHEFFGQVELLRLLQSREAELRVLRENNRKLAAQLAAREELVRQLRALSVDGG